MITDFHWTLDALDKMGCKTLTDRWRQWLTTGSWVVKDHPFWTTPLSFWNLKEHGGEAYEDIRTAGLTIYKGDLNYRRMLFDGTWPKTTPFKDAVGPFHSPETKPFLMLRTGKSDVAVGLLPGQEDALKAKDPHWEINGKWGLIQFYPGYDQAV